ncbi:MAG: hypothetical protein AAF805_00795 [Planctomycetota bacterium]
MKLLTGTGPSVKFDKAEARKLANAMELLRSVAPVERSRGRSAYADRSEAAANECRAAVATFAPDHAATLGCVNPAVASDEAEA